MMADSIGEGALVIDETDQYEAKCSIRHARSNEDVSEKITETTGALSPECPEICSTGTFACNVCEMTFNRKELLRRHGTIHTGVKPHSCEDCGKNFRLASGLRNHVRTHSGERPYPCEVCGKAFAQKGNLIIHLRTHTGEKPFACETCGRKFSQIANLQAHLRIHTGEMPYVCSECSRGFRQLSSLQSHQRSNHISPGRKKRSSPDKTPRQKKRTPAVAKKGNFGKLIVRINLGNKKKRCDDMNLPLQCQSLGDIEDEPTFIGDPGRAMKLESNKNEECNSIKLEPNENEECHSIKLESN